MDETAGYRRAFVWISPYHMIRRGVTSPILAPYAYKKQSEENQLRSAIKTRNLQHKTYRTVPPPCPCACSCFCFAIILLSAPQLPRILKENGPEDIVDFARCLRSNFQTTTLKERLPMPVVAVAVSSVSVSWPTVDQLRIK